jgi:hypothetical protein
MVPQRETPLQVAWILRIGVAMEFIGHGALGIGHVPAWIPYFGVVGIQSHAAFKLMPLVGAADVALGLAVLIRPVRRVILYMAAWGLFTAILRPLAGESGWEAVERAGNFGAAAALFLMEGGGGALDDTTRARVSRVLQLTTAGLLAGHGALGLLERKPLLVAQYAAIGLPEAWLEPLVGGFEIALAAAVLVRPGFGLLVFVFAWKLATEALSPITGSTLWVFVEHGGSYAAPLALVFLNRSGGGAPSRDIRAAPA